MNESPGAAAAPAPLATIGHADRRWLFEGLGLTIVVIVLAVIFSLINPRFATVVNFINILTQASYYVIIAVGMTFVITNAGIDLSVGALLALVTVIGFELIKEGMHPGPRGPRHVRAGRPARLLHGLSRRLRQDPAVHCDPRDDGGPAGARPRSLRREHALRAAVVDHVVRPGHRRRHPGAGDHRLPLRPVRRLALQPHPLRPCTCAPSAATGSRRASPACRSNGSRSWSTC